MHRILRRLAATATLASIAWAAPALAQAPHYRFNNFQLGLNMSMDVGDLAGQAHKIGMMLQTSEATGQYWTITPIGGGFVRLSNTYTGRNQCLDVANDGAVFMDGCRGQLGQRWRIEGVVGGVRLTNVFAAGRCLDVFSGPNLTVPAMRPCAGTPSQTWIVALTGTQ